jgi:hypothetical protein
MCTLLFLALVVLGAGYWARSKGYKIPFIGKKEINGGTDDDVK